MCPVKVSVIPTFVLLGINLAAQEAFFADEIYRIRFQKLHYCPFLAAKRMGAIFEHAGHLQLRGGSRFC